jgi:deaminated glutathione amidase
MSQGKISVATCQFAVTGSIRRNSQTIRRYICQASDANADLLHVPECALSGYGGIDVPNFVDYDWPLLKQETEGIQALAAQKKLWVVLGSAHALSQGDKPLNCLYLINSDGDIVDRYDKRFCLKAELCRYTSGDHAVTFELNGVKCALLICFDVRFPEIYREVYQQKVQCVFQSFYNARQKGPSVHSDIMRQSMQCRAASNHLWASMSNSSAHYSPYGSCLIRPDGKIVQQLKRNRPGLMINTVDVQQSFYDPMESYRDMAINGRLNNGQCAGADSRAMDRTSL